jgi:adenylate cyclase
MKLAQLYKKPTWLFALVSALAVVLMAVVSNVWAPQLQQWEERLASRTWQLASQDATERRVVVVDIDEKSTQALGPWPWPRDRVATLLSGLDAYGVNLKVVDVLFDGAQNPTQDAKLAQALQAGAPTVVAQLFALSPDAQLKSGQLAGSVGACPANTPEASGFMGPEAIFAQSKIGRAHV